MIHITCRLLVRRLGCNLQSAVIDHVYNLDKRLRGDNIESNPVSLWIPSERVAIHRIAKPTAPRRKWLGLVPWILEEKILQPAEKTHFVIGHDATDELVDVFAVSKDDLNTWANVARNAGFAPIQMTPDYFALPWDEGRISMAWREGDFLVRHSFSEGFSAKPDLAWAMIESLLRNAKIPPRLSISVPDAEIIPQHLRDQAEVNNAFLDWQMIDMGSEVNLLSGDYRPILKGRQANLWQLNIAGLAITVMLLVAYFNVLSTNLLRDLNAIERHLTSSFDHVFRGQKVSPEQVQTAGRKEITRLKIQGRILNTEPIAALISLEKLMNNCECNLVALKADQHQITIHLEGGKKLLARNLSMEGYSLNIERETDKMDEFIMVIRPKTTS